MMASFLSYHDFWSYQDYWYIYHTAEKIFTFIWYDNVSSPYKSFLRLRFAMSERESNSS